MLHQPVYPIEKPITNTIREAILNNQHRDGQLEEISSELIINRQKAKQLFFAFLWQAEEDLLDRMAMADEQEWIP